MTTTPTAVDHLRYLQGLDDDDMRAALRCASLLRDRLLLQGVALPQWFVRHQQRLLTMSARGHENRSRPPQLTHEHTLGVQEVAHMVNMSPRQIRRNATKFGGVKIGRDWRFDSRDVLEHVEGMQGR